MPRRRRGDSTSAQIEGLATDMVTHLMEAHTTTQQTNKLLNAVHHNLAMYLSSGRFRREKSTQRSWHRQVEAAGHDALRICTVELESTLSNRPRFVYFDTTKDPRPTDGSAKYRHQIEGGGQEIRALSGRPVAQTAGSTAQRLVEQYLTRLLNEELREVAMATSRATLPGYTAVASVDYYTDRPLGTNVLHKDTAGNTLFVALHYINPGAMLGPEFIIDQWPIAADKGRHHFTVVGEDRRTRAPWMVDSKRPTRTYWPDELLQALELARRQVEPDRVEFQHVDLTANGLVSFVDELIYHTTPLSERRGDDNADIFDTVSMGGTRYTLLPARAQRSVSTVLRSGGSLPSATGGAQRRSFVRLWLSIVPTDWLARV